MNKSKEPSECDCGSIVGCHLCGKSVREIENILLKPKSTVNGVIFKWKRRCSETAEKRTGRLKKLGETLVGRKNSEKGSETKSQVLVGGNLFPKNSKAHQALVLAAGLFVES
ncbi:hypothetical protein HNY73_006441 [Argiope bruennichi]|uniref:Uncharacterized protein n=1 Tax=Argiope bruennichi TaxID=94029 RepID=A0A8T0FPP7_ARGBR|nr:hypothetical protein HNY73_006441 [Argiope bruennichi]